MLKKFKKITTRLVIKSLLFILSVLFLTVSLIIHNMGLFLVGFTIFFYTLSMSTELKKSSIGISDDIIMVFFLMPFIIPFFIICVKEKNIWFSDIHLDNWVIIFGSLLAYFGTISLGLVSIKQNDRLSSVNKKLAQLQMEEYTPFLQIISFFETMPDPARVPDTTQSILFGSLEYMPQDEIKKIEDEGIKKLKDFSIDDSKTITPEIMESLKKSEIEFVRKIKKQQRITIEKHGDIFWILKKDCKIPGQDTLLPDNLEKKTFKFVFQNNTKAKIKKIVFQKLLLDNADQKWEYVPNKLHDCLNEILMPQNCLNLNINLYWEEKDKLTELFELLQTSITFKIRLITLGGNSQDEEIRATIDMGKIFELTYNLYETN